VRLVLYQPTPLRGFQQRLSASKVNEAGTL
jgi:hypothetical protein